MFCSIDILSMCMVGLVSIKGSLGPCIVVGWSREKYVDVINVVLSGILMATKPLLTMMLHTQLILTWLIKMIIKICLSQSEMIVAFSFWLSKNYFQFWYKTFINAYNFISNHYGKYLYYLKVFIVIGDRLIIIFCF